MVLSYLPKMHINNFASLEVIMVEMTDNILRLCYIGQKLTFNDLSILPMTFNHILLMFPMIILDFL